MAALVLSRDLGALQCSLVIEDGVDAPEAVRRLGFDLSATSNTAELVASGDILQACALMRRPGPDRLVSARIELKPEVFTFDESSGTLSLDLCSGPTPSGPLSPGFYRIRLCGDFLLMGMPDFSDESLLEQQNGAPIKVEAYSVPSMADWNADGLPDLIVGAKIGTDSSAVRVWLNEGTRDTPLFANSSLPASTAAAEISLPSGGCLGVFPRFVDWDQDGLADLLIGTADGDVLFCRNEGTAASPVFAAQQTVLCGNVTKIPIDVGRRATLDVADWDGDGRHDLVVGALDGKIRVYVNRADSGMPDLADPVVLSGAGDSEMVPGKRSSPCLIDVNNDGKADILSGNTEGQLIGFLNSGTAQIPSFDAYFHVRSNDDIIDLPGTPRSRPWLGDYNGDGVLDVLIGAEDGYVRLYRGHVTDNPIPGCPRFAEEKLLRDSGGLPIAAAAYSTPFFSDWNGDDLPDLVSGEKDPSGNAYVRIWLNTGTPGKPQFDTTMPARSGGEPLTVPAAGCLGVYVRTHDWNKDGRQDLVLGLADGGPAGSFEVWVDTMDAGEPDFERAGRIRAGADGTETPLVAGRRATFDFADIDGDGLDDLVFGELGGSIQYAAGKAKRGPSPVFAAPVILTTLADLLPTEVSNEPEAGRRTSVHVTDLNSDGLPDIVTGNTCGWVIAAVNTGTRTEPKFTAGARVEAEWGNIDLPGDPRSRPWVGDVNADARPDLLVGAQDGLMRLFTGVPWETCFEADFAVLGIDGPDTHEVVDAAQFSALPAADSCSYQWDFGERRNRLSGEQVAYSFTQPGTHTITVFSEMPDGTRYGAAKQVQIVHTRNHAPVMDPVRLAGSGPGEITAVTGGWWDYEGAPEAYDYKWSVNGRQLVGQTGPTLSTDLIPANGFAYCDVTPVNAPVEGKTPEPAEADTGACAFVTDVAAGWNLVYSPDAVQAARAAAKSGADERQQPVAPDAPIWGRSQSGQFTPREGFVAGSGFWTRVDAPAAGPAIFFGRRPSLSAGWETGWRIVGVAEESSDSRENLSGLPRDTLSLWKWDRQHCRYLPVADSEALMPGRGYWGHPE